MPGIARQAMIIIAAAALFALSPARTGTASEPPGTADNNGPSYGSLNIGVHPENDGPVCFTLRDPAGRRMSTGPPCEDTELSEIPDSYNDYESIDDDETGAPGPVIRVIYIGHPMPGEYQLSLTLPDDESYDLEVQSYDKRWGTSHRLLAGQRLTPGRTRKYVITCPGGPGEELVIREVR